MVLNLSGWGVLLTVLLVLEATGVAQNQAPPIRVGSTVQAPVKTRHVAPVYPPDAQRAGIQGVVVVEVVVGVDGRVTDARVLRSAPLLDQAALEAVRQWEFAPTSINGNAVPIVMTVTVNFTLPADGSPVPSADPAVAQQDTESDVQPCAETPERTARIRAAVRFAEELNSNQRIAVIVRQVRRYLPLEELPSTMVAPEGFDVHFLLAGGRYSLALKDVQDRCGASVFTDQTGSIHIGVLVTGR